MKKILIGLILTVSFSAFAETPFLDTSYLKYIAEDAFNAFRNTDEGKKFLDYGVDAESEIGLNKFLYIDADKNLAELTISYSVSSDNDSSSDLQLCKTNMKVAMTGERLYSLRGSDTECTVNEDEEEYTP